MIPRTKIVATIGPASGSVDMIRQLARAGADVFRINFSHGANEQRLSFLQNIRLVEKELGEPLAVMADLCGPKIRVGMMAGGSAVLKDGGEIIIQREIIEGTAARISTTLAELADQVEPGQRILLDDGKLRLEVAKVNRGKEFTCRIIRGGELSSGKGINLPETTLALSALTQKDRADAQWIAQQDFDYVALSFVRSPEDIQELRDLLRAAGRDLPIIAKIEKPQAMARIEEIVAAADGIMVARGDMGVEMDLPAVPMAQKRITSLCHRVCKPCIVATQMLESMINAPIPTRAEVSDVANACLDHADAVMLSGETAMGKFPAEAVAMMDRIVASIEEYDAQTYHGEPVHCASSPTTGALAGAVRGIIAADHIAAVAVYTATGATALMFAKNHLSVPVLGIAPNMTAARRMCMYYGVGSAIADAPEHTRDVLELASKFAVQKGLAKPGDKIIVVSGRPIGTPGKTNTLVVHTVA